MAGKQPGGRKMHELSPLQWVPVQGAEGPHLRNHSGMCIGDFFYVHGGAASNDAFGRDVSNGLYRIRISPSVSEWVDLTTGDSPTLSQHACFGILDRYIAFVGGWNGQARIPGVHTYDTANDRWLPAAVSEPLLKGFPSGAGLSAHTVTAMKPSGPKNLPTALIIGREGSLRTQRKAGNVYLLYLDLSSPDSPATVARYTYCEVNEKLLASSRSYHTSTPISFTTLVTIGGRRDHPVELLTWNPNKRSHCLDWPGSLLYPSAKSVLVSDFVRKVRSGGLTAPCLPSSTRSCWRGHTAVPGDGGILISSGESFNALDRDPLDSAYLFLSSETRSQKFLYNIGKLQYPRAYGVVGMHEKDGTAWLHGGIGSKGATQNTLLRLEQLHSLNEEHDR